MIHYGKATPWCIIHRGMGLGGVSYTTELHKYIFKKFHSVRYTTEWQLGGVLYTAEWRLHGVSYTAEW